MCVCVCVCVCVCACVCACVRVRVGEGVGGSPDGKGQPCSGGSVQKDWRKSRMLGALASGSPEMTQLEARREGWGTWEEGEGLQGARTEASPWGEEARKRGLVREEKGFGKGREAERHAGAGAHGSRISPPPPLKGVPPHPQHHVCARVECLRSRRAQPGAWG